MRYAVMCFVLALAALAARSAIAGCQGNVGEEFLQENDGDDRLVRTESSPEWLEAVGRMVSVTNASQADQGEEKKHELCSVSLLSDTIGKDGQIVVGAGHCVDQWAAGEFRPSPYVDDYKNTHAGEHYDRDDMYFSNVEPHHTSITFTSSGGQKVERQLAQIFSAHMAHQDYFIGRLDRPIPYSQIKPLLNSPADYSDMLDQDEFPGAFATMAGFSADSGRGENGNKMTYDVCMLAGGQQGYKMGHCYTYGGASGGATAVTVDLSKSDPETAEFWIEYIEDTLNGTFERKEYTFWVGNIVGSRCSQAKMNRTFFTESTVHTRLLDAILRDH